MVHTLASIAIIVGNSLKLATGMFEDFKMKIKNINHHNLDLSSDRIYWMQ